MSTGSSVLNLHAKDMSHHPSCSPDAVVWPTSAGEVANILRFANENLIPVVGWGAESSLEGNPIPVKKGIVLDFTSMNRILDIRTEDFQVDMEPGVIYQDLNQQLKDTGLFFPPDPGARVAKSSSGYNLLNLFVGSEGTLGIVVKATLSATPVTATCTPT